MKALSNPVALGAIPKILQVELFKQYGNVANHLALEEWDDLHVDAGRFIEVVLRILEWYMKGSFTPIDGKNKPNRSQALNSARQSLLLASSLRQQIPTICELVLDFRNNRNSAHLGDVDPAKFDGVTVAQQCAWVLGELIRLEGAVPIQEIQAILDSLAERPASLVYELQGRPIVLSTTLNYDQVALVQLYAKKQPVRQRDLYEWSGHSHITRWRRGILDNLQKAKEIFVSDGMVHLLPLGIRRAENIIRTYRDE